MLKLDPDSINRTKEAFEILKALFRAFSIFTRGSKCGPNSWQQHHRKSSRRITECCKKGEGKFTSIWDRWQNDVIHRQSQHVHYWSDAWIRYLNHVVQCSIYHNAPQQQRERNIHRLYFRSVDENRQAPPLSQRRGYQEAKDKIRTLQKEKREQLAPFIPVSERKR